MKKIILKLHAFIAHPLAKGSFIILVGSMVANVGAYAYHVLVGRLLGPVIYGEFSALLSLFYIINIGSGVVQTILAKFFSQLRARKLLEEVPSLFWAAFRYISLVSLIGFLVAVVSSHALSEFLHISSSYFIWLYFLFVSFIFSVINISIMQSFQLFLASSVVTNIGMLLRLVFGVLGAPFGLIGVLIGNIISNVISYGINFVPIWGLIRVKSKPLSITRADAADYSLPTLLATLGTIALYSQDVLLVRHFFSPYEAGIYASLAVLGKVIFYTSAALGFVMFPMIVEKKERKESYHGMVLSALGAVAALSSILTLGYFIAPAFIVRIMYGTAFDGAIPFMGLFGIFITFFTLVNLLITIFLAIGRMRVWVITMGAAITQAIGLWLFHASLYQVIYINIAVAFLTCMILLIYYRYGKD